jgi:phage tail-like protein
VADPLTDQQVADPLADQQATYPLPAYNYHVTVGTDEMSFSEVSGIVVVRAYATYRHGLSFMEEGEQLVTYAAGRFTPVTFTRGTFHRQSWLHGWLRSRRARKVSISLRDGRSTALVTWKMERVVPIRLHAPSFDVYSSEVAVETLEVLAAGISVTHEEV